MLTSRTRLSESTDDLANKPVVVDLFGAAGWGEALQARDLTTVAMSHDWTTRRTAHAAGHAHVPIDPAASSPLTPARKSCGVVSTPPPHLRHGQELSSADLYRVIACGSELGNGLDHRDRHRAAADNEQSMLLLDPLRWILRLEPDWFALEQAPEALPAWDAFAEILRAQGYVCEAGILMAETLGVPQIREHAVLVGSRRQAVHLPDPSHQRHRPFGPAEANEFRETPRSFQALGLPAWGVLRTGSPVRSGGKRYANDFSLSDLAPVLGATSPDWRTHAALQDSGGAWTRNRPRLPGLRLAPSHRRRLPRLTAAQAGALQGFPAEYPWCGTRSQQFRQIVSAVPPPVAAALIEAAAGPPGVWPA